MKDNKFMFVLGGAIFIVAAGVTVFFLAKRNTADISDISDMTAEINIGDEMGIHYGGDFDEFQYQENESGIDIKSDENEENENETTKPMINEIQTETDIPDDLEDIEKIKEKFESELPGEILKESDELNILNGNLQMAGQTGEIQETQETETVSQTAGDNEKSDNVTLSNDLGLIVLESDGYEKNMVICDAQSLEEAEKTAAEIGGTVLSCEQGTATIKIKENVDELLERLKQQGSNLELHRKYKFK